MNFDWLPEDNEQSSLLDKAFDQTALADVEDLEHADPAELRRLTLGLQKRLTEAGYLSMGLGAKPSGEMMAMLAAREKLARLSSSLFLSTETTARLFGVLVANHGWSVLSSEILDPLRAGRIIGAVAMAEQGGDSPTPECLTSAVFEADHYVVSGRKSFVANGPIADWIAVTGRAGERPAVFLLRPGQTGLALGPRLQTLGHQGLAVCALELDQVHVPSAHVLGPFDSSAPLDQLRIRHDQILSVHSVGLMERTLDAANRYARTYHRGDKPIYAHQEVRFKLADMVTLLQTSQLLNRRAVWLQAVDHAEAATVSACAKVFTAEAAEKVAALAMQIMAGQGYLAGNTVERGYREAKYAALAGTTSEISRMNIADEMIRRNPV